MWSLAGCLSGNESTESETSEAVVVIEFRASLGLNERDEQIIRQFIGHATTFAVNLKAEAVAEKCRKHPEMFAWVEFNYLKCLNVAYELTGDTDYLDLLSDTFDANFKPILGRGPDDYLGWYGSPITPRIPKDNPDIQIDEIQMNFRAIGMLAEWIELAREDGAYAAKKKEVIDVYLELMEKHLFPKWDERGHFSLIEGRGGVYHGLDYPIKGGVTLSHEKLSIIVDACLRLYRVTGNDLYMQRALLVGQWFKSCLTEVDGHYEWMSWVPAGEWDRDSSKENGLKISWVAPDPNSQWYVSALSIALNLYQYGLLFSEEDLKRFVQTQKTMCWNGDVENPEYRNVAGHKNEWVKGRFLSYQIAPYDATLTQLAFYGPHEEEVEAKADSSWQGGANGRSYIVQKYLMQPLVKGAKQPFTSIGLKFLKQKKNQAFLKELTYPADE